MNDTNCPWCECSLEIAAADEADEQTCPECNTTWAYEDAQVELALAA